MAYRFKRKKRLSVPPVPYKPYVPPVPPVPAKRDKYKAPELDKAPLDRTNYITLNDWASWIERAENGQAPEDINRSSRAFGRDQWTGGVDWTGALALAKNGWPEKGSLIQAKALPLFDKLASAIIRPEPRYVTEGNVLDIGRWIEGEPEHWLMMAEGDNPTFGHQIAKVVYNISASAGVSTDVMMAKGATIATVIRLLEYAGFRVELELVSALISQRWEEQNAYRAVARVPVKMADQDLDMDRIAFALAHPASFRRIIFSLFETMDKEWTSRCHIGSSYGYPENLRSNEYSPEALYIGSSMLGEPEWTDEDSAISWVFEQLERFEVPLKLD